MSLLYTTSNQILERKSSINALGSDLDGMLTNIETNDMYSLFYETFLGFSPPYIRKPLEKKVGKPENIDKILERYKISIGWSMDYDCKTLILTDPDGKIISVRMGNKRLDKENKSDNKRILDIYKKGYVDVQLSLDPDNQQPRIVPIGDGFDKIEAIVLMAISDLHGLPFHGTMKAIRKTWRMVHDPDLGYKTKIMENPHIYGITPNPDAIDFFTNLGGEVLRFLVTSSSLDFTEFILDAIGLLNHFEFIITDVKKPKCFYEPIVQNEIWGKLRSYGINDPSTVFYIGDHPYKDSIAAKKMGFNTGLRMRRNDATETIRKLDKYASLSTTRDGNITKLSQDNSRCQKDLSNYIHQLSTQVDVITTNIQGLAPIFLYK